MNFSDNFFDDSYNESFWDDEKLKSKVNKCKEYVSRGQTIAFLENIEQTIQLCLEYDFTEDGIFLAEAALEITPYSSELWHSKGIFYNNLFEFQKAYDCFQKSLSLNPSDVEALINKSIAEDNLDMWEEAIQTLEYAITLEPNNEEAIFNLGIFYERRDYFDKAVEYFEKTVVLDPEYADAWYELGYCYENNEQFPEAINAYDKFLEIEPYSASGWYNKGIVFLHIKDFHEAVNCFDLAIAVNDEFLNAHFNRGIAYSKLNRYSDARESFFRAYELDLFDKTIPINIAYTYEAVGDYDSAIRYFDESLNINHLSIEAFIGKGNCYARKNNYNEMLNAFSNVIKLNLAENIDIKSTNSLKQELDNIFSEIIAYEVEKENSVSSLTNLAENYFYIGNWNAAKSCYEEILEKNPGSSDSYYEIALCNFMLNENEKAIKSLIKAFEINPSIETKFLEEFEDFDSTQLYIKLTGLI